jgi:hypothetical protein
LTRDLICNTSRALAGTVLVNVVSCKEVRDSAVCAIADVIGMLAMTSLFVTACTDPKVLDGRSIWFEQAPAILVYETLACAFASSDTS